ncbi:hypothetical protein [Bacillus sp. FJAT-50079]|uniref:hypothetical protein n=1 Tax=Bacillus sp. FJAT-50079 TaxID=2833577 RepID=UPI001BC907B1|nr:hypothetical protein [Bacillus sp. FJAT-50079]MBS4209053.1 hypothetical protein [Bacillus sp. FJAT-50079]
MRNFIVKCLVLVIVFYAGVYIGVNKTSEELGHEQKQSFPSPVSKEELERMQVKVHEETADMNMPNVEKKTEAPGKNVLSEIGKGLAVFVTSFAQKTISLFTHFI